MHLSTSISWPPHDSNQLNYRTGERNWYQAARQDTLVDELISMFQNEFTQGVKEWKIQRNLDQALGSSNLHLEYALINGLTDTGDLPHNGVRTWTLDNFCAVARVDGHRKKPGNQTQSTLVLLAALLLSLLQMMSFTPALQKRTISRKRNRRAWGDKRGGHD